MTPPTVAALFVDPKGVYSGLEGVEVWDEARDARLYAGPWPVVAHPPCARWCRLAGFIEWRGIAKRGDDGGCFEAALTAVRRFGGVLEHPAHSRAWDAYGLPEPQTDEGWTAGFCGGWSAYVEQGRYGAPVRKATWLYAYGVELCPLRWGRVMDRDAEGAYSWTGIGGAAKDGRKERPRLPGSATARTPGEFRDTLLALARTATVATPDNAATPDNRASRT